jgi:YbbR domain-containing protein
VKEIGLKLFSLLIALLLFFVVRGQSNSAQVSFIAPIEILNLPPDRVVLLPSVRQAQVTVRGPAFLVSQVAASAPALRIKLPNELGNHYEVPLGGREMRLPPEVEVVGIDPSGIELIFDRRVSKTVPVEVPRIGSLSSDLQLLSFQIEPKEVTVVGPETEVKEIRRVETFPVDLRDLKKNLNQELALRTPWQHTQVSKYALAAVKIEVITATAERKFGDLPIDVRSRDGKHYKVAPARVNLEVSGPKDAVAKLGSSDLLPYVRADAKPAGSQEAPVMVDAPDGISVIYLDPQKVAVLAAVEPSPSASSPPGGKQKKEARSRK